MDNDKNKDYDLTDLSELNNKYNHYFNSEAKDNFSERPVVKKMTDEFEDISSYSEGNADFYMNPREEIRHSGKAEVAKKTKQSQKGNFFTRNQYKNTKIVALLIIISILLTIGGFLIHLVVSTSNGDWDDDGIDYNTGNDDYIVEDDHDWQAMGDVNADSLNDFLYSWANNGGEKMYSKNVINVLLCGVDSETGDASSGRSDIMMLVSINKVTKKITMASFLRDSWTYIRVPKEDGTSYDYYFKMNAAYSKGGPATLLQTIENNFKIEIDEYIAVDFNSFPKLIDALGGVEVEVQDYEAKYIRRTSSQKNFPSGVATLNGTQALIYSRIRKCDADSDISRTRRQRSVIKALIYSAKTATKGQLLNAFKQVSGYLRTGYSQSEVFALVAQAVTHNWMNFEMVELVLPNEDFVDRATSNINGQDSWVVDYALCAQKLQMALYGETNIVLDADRKSVLDLVTNRRETTTRNYYNNSSNGNSNSGDNNDYYKPTSTTSADYNDYNSDDTTSSSVNDSDTSSTTTSTRPEITLPSFNIPGLGDNDSNNGNEDVDTQDTTSGESVEN